jgi:Domain of unknown function (DUF3576)
MEHWKMSVNFKAGNLKGASLRSGVAVVGALMLVACASTPDQARGGGFPFGKPSERPAPAAPAGIGVNAFLWRASLDTLSFMPLASADPFGGVIITDWYANPEKPDERFKATVYILDTRLRADGVSVTVFKQVKDAAGGWTNAPVSSQTDVDVENAILTRARQLKLSTINVKG